MKYLLIKNWDIFQPTEKLKKGASVPWVKDYTDKEFDREYMNLSFFQRYVLDALCRMRGRLGHDIPYDDPTWVARLLHANRRDASHVAQAVLRLIADGFLIECFVEDTSRELEGEGEKENKEGERKGEASPSATLSQPLKKSIKGVSSKSKAAIVGEDL